MVGAVPLQRSSQSAVASVQLRLGPTGVSLQLDHHIDQARQRGGLW
jgi:hypothetical protein